MLQDKRPHELIWLLSSSSMAWKKKASLSRLLRVSRLESLLMLLFHLRRLTYLGTKPPSAPIFDLITLAGS